MTLKSIFVIQLLIVLLMGCKSNPLDVDASGEKVAINYVHLDSLFVHSSPSDLQKLHRRHLEEIREIYTYELGYCLGIGGSDNNDTSFLQSIHLFLSDPYIARLEKRIADKFPNLAPYKKEINSGFQHIKHHLPKAKLPEHVVFMNSFFASNAFSTEKQIGIGLERYLGSTTDVIRELPSDPFYKWIKDGMHASFLSRDAICSWVMTHLVEEVDGNLAENIIRWGKVIYLTQAALPKFEPAVILRYTENDYKWAIDNEYSIWKYLVDEKLLFKSDDRTKLNLLKEGPYTVGLSEKGPDRLGQFLGFRIIQKFMEVRKCSVEEMLNSSYSDILVEYEID
jgi:hypothetical protein